MTTMLDRPTQPVTSEQLLAIIASTKTPTVPTVSSGRTPRGIVKNNPTSRAWSMGGDVD